MCEFEFPLISYSVVVFNSFDFTFSVLLVDGWASSYFLAESSLSGPSFWAQNKWKMVEQREKLLGKIWWNRKMCVYKRNKRRRRLQKTQNQIDCDFGSCTQRRARLAIRFESVLRRWRWREANRDESGFNQIVHTASSSRCCIVFLPGRITKIKRSVDTPVLGILFSHGKQNKVEIGRIGCRSRLLPLPVTTTSDHAIDTTEIGQKWWRSRMIQFLEKSRRRFFLSYFSPFSFLGFPVDAFLFSLLLFLILLLSARWLLSSPANHIRLNLTDSQKKKSKKE